MKHVIFTVSILFCCACTGLFGATNSQTVTYTISGVNSLTISGNPAPMTIGGAVAGSQPMSASDSSTTYNLTTNNVGQRITASLNTAMPSNVTLAMRLAAPAGASSAGSVVLSTSAQNFVTSVSQVSQSNLTITYTLSATVAAAPQGPLTRMITFTLGP